MKLGLLADVHTNYAALLIALELLEREGVDEILLAGDAIYEFRFSNEVVRTLQERGVRMVLGNHEEGFLVQWHRLDPLRLHADRDLVRWLEEQPVELRSTVNGRSLFMFHSSPWQPPHEYLTPGRPRLSDLATLGFDIVVYGHTHWQLAQRFGSTLVINPGSAGEPRDRRNGLLCSVAVLETADLSVKFLNFPDPAQASRLAGQGYPRRGTTPRSRDATDD